MTTTPLPELFPTSAAIPAAVAPEVDDVGLTLLVDGRLERFSGPAQPIVSPVRLRSEAGALAALELGPAALGDGDVGRRALAAATRAWAGGRGDWPLASPDERIACVERFLAAIAPLRERVARRLMWEVGKPYRDCLVEFDRTVDYARETIAALVEMERHAQAPVRAGGFVARIRRAPLGPTLCMGPFNYAINEVWTLALPALLMGNPVVVKTPRYGIAANALLAPALAAAFPAGVVNLVSGDGAALVGPMMASGEVEVLAFIGAARTAGILERQHPRPYRLRRVLGLGAKNPAIVLADADLDLAAREIAAGALTFNGQRCTAVKLVLAERAVAGELLERLRERIEGLAVGMPWQEGVTITPLPDARHPAYLAGLVEEAVARGARVVNRGGGESVESLFRPALVAGLGADCRLFHEEQFGPIVPFAAVASAEEAIEVVARSEFGQQVALFGRDAKRLGPLVDQLANLVCRVNLNSQCRRGPDLFPFTGRKESAVGTLSITDALRLFSLRSLVATPESGAALLAELAATSRFLAVG